MEKTLAKANEIINAKANYIGGGLEGYAVLSLLDENGYPSASAITIAKSGEYEWLTFASSPDSNKAKRISQSNKASVCIASPEYNITLVGTIEEVKDMAVKKDTWGIIPNEQPHWNGFDDPNFYVMRFNTERYNIYIIEGEEELVAVGTASKQTLSSTNTLSVEPILAFAGNASEAIDLYVKAFDATVPTKLRFSDANSADWQCSEAEKDLIYYAEIKVGKQTIALGDNADAVKNGVVKNSGNAFAIDLLVHFDTDKSLKTAYALLSAGGEVTAPLTSQTYCSLTCRLVDKFGGRWQLMSGYKG